MTNQIPTLLVEPPRRKSYGSQIQKLSKLTGITLDEWQINVANSFTGVDSRGHWVADLCGICVSRQQGKSQLLVALILAGVYLFDEELVVFSGHTAKNVKDIFNRVKVLIETTPQLSSRLKKVMSADGREYIELHPVEGKKRGCRIEFFTRSGSNVRGFSADRIILDEVQDLSEAHLESILYAVSGKPNHQVILSGTVPAPGANGEVFQRHHELAVKAAQGEDAPRFVWCEWSAPAGSDIYDDEIVKRVNPGYGHRLTQHTVDRERSSSTQEGFARERLSMWAQAGGLEVIPSQLWAEQASDVAVEGEIAIGVDTNHDRSVTAVSIAWLLEDGDYATSLVEQFGNPSSAVKFVRDLMDKNAVRAVVLDAKSQAATLIDDFKKSGIRVTVTNERDMATGCARFFDGITDGWLYHTGQVQLSNAVSQARKRPIGDAWGWNRKNTSSDITPLVACTLALFGATNSKVRRPGRAAAASPTANDKSSGQRMIVLR